MLRNIAAIIFSFLVLIALVADDNFAVNSTPTPLQENLQWMLDIAVWRGATNRMRFLILMGAKADGKVSPQFTCGNASEEDIAQDYHYPLQSAAWAGQNAAVEVLLNHGADVNAIDGNGRTALWYVALGGHASTARLLISRGANVNPPKGSHWLEKTPLEEALANGEQAVVEVLLASGAKR